MDKEKNYKYYFIITLANVEVNLHKILLRTNKKNFFGFLGAGKDDKLLKPIFQTNLNDVFDALVFYCSFSFEVQEFLISLESNHGINYNSKVFNILDFPNKNKQFVFFNFNLKFEDVNYGNLRSPPRTSNLDPFKSFQILRSYLLEEKKNVTDLYGYSLNYVNQNVDLLMELMNSMKDEKIENLYLLIDKIDFKFLFSELKIQNKFVEFKKILDKKLEEIFKYNVNIQEKDQLPQIKFQKLKLILYDDEKILIPTLELLNPPKIFECIETIISLEK